MGGSLPPTPLDRVLHEHQIKTEIKKMRENRARRSRSPVLGLDRDSGGGHTCSHDESAKDVRVSAAGRQRRSENTRRAQRGAPCIAVVLPVALGVCSITDARQATTPGAVSN